MGIEVADLFATLGLKPDEAAWAKGDKLIEKVKHGLEAFAGIEMVRKVGEAVTSVVELGSNLNDTAQKTGLSVEALQEYGYIAKQNSSNTEEFSHAVIKLSHGLGGVDAATGPAAKALAQLGISVNDPKFKNANLDDKITMISQALGKLPDGTRKTALAMDLFGRSGANLIPTLNDISQNGAELRAEFKAMGGELSGDDAAGLDKLGDTIDKAKAQFSALKNEVVVALLPSLQEMIDSMLEWVKANKELIASGIHAAVHGLMILMEGLGIAIKAVATVLEFLEEHAELAKLILTALGIVLGAIAVEATAAWLASLAPIALVVGAVMGLILVFKDFLRGLLDGKGVTASVLGWIGDKFKGMARTVLDAFKAIGHFFESIASAIKSAFVAVIDWITDKISWAWDQVKKVAHAIRHPGEAIEGAVDYFTGGGDDSPGPITSPAAADAYRPVSGGGSGPVTNIDARANLTVNANGVDPQGVVDIANKQIDQHHARVWRDADADLGGKDDTQP